MNGPLYPSFVPQSPPPSLPLTPQTSLYQNASNFSIGAQNVTVHNGPHTAYIGGIEPPQAIPNADHNRNRKISPPDSHCLPGTRNSLRSKIISWALDPQSDQVILWLCGSVGSGKSAVAQAVAEELDHRRRLAASFFFFRGSGERSQFARFPITLANQIASAVPGAGKYVWEAVAKLSGWSVRKQMEELVYGPIRRAFADNPREGPVIIVIDGLDECEDRDEMEEFIEHLLEYFDEHSPLNFRLIISSRIEEHIQSRLETRSVQIENLANHILGDDILTFLTVTFSRAARQSRVIRAYGKWPTDMELQTLLEHISGSFIFAATLVKYILGPSDSDGLTPMERLPLALNMNPGLDGLYTETLKRCYTFPYFTDIIAAIGFAFDPMSIATLSWFLGIPSFRVLNVLVQLQAIIHVPGDDHRTPITLFHSSLRDFLVTESRSGPFFISPAHHERFAFRWLEAVPPPKPRTGVDFCPQCFQVDCSTLRRAQWHWESRWRGLNPITSNVLRYINGTIGHFFHQDRHNDLALVRIAAEYAPFLELAVSVPTLQEALPTLATDLGLQEALASIGPGNKPYHRPSHISIVRDGIRFFNGCLLSPDSLVNPSKPSDYVLRHWVKHLGDAVRRDTTLTLEFLQKRDYKAVKPVWIIKHSVSLEFMDLKDDVLSAQDAIEKRFPGALPVPIQGSGPRLTAKFNDTRGGVSVLDQFNAYRTFVRIASSSGFLENHFYIEFTNKRRKPMTVTTQIAFQRHEYRGEGFVAITHRLL